MKNIPILLIIVFLIVACDSDSEFEKSHATVIDSGSPALDGCGWLVEIGSKTYKPINLPVEFEIDELEVTITYKVLKAKGNCDVPNSIRQIDIKKIVEK